MNIPTQEETNDLIVKAAVSTHFISAFTSLEPGEKITPYMVKLAKAIVG